jgi:hypothetical protein
MSLTSLRLLGRGQAKGLADAANYRTFDGYLLKRSGNQAVAVAS